MVCETQMIAREDRSANVVWPEMCSYMNGDETEQENLLLFLLPRGSGIATCSQESVAWTENARGTHVTNHVTVNCACNEMSRKYLKYGADERT